MGRQRLSRRRRSRLTCGLAAVAALAGAGLSHAATTEYRGAFQCPDGRPLAGAQVQLLRWHYTWLPKLPPNIEMLGTAATADANGRWGFRFTSKHTNRDLFARVVLTDESAQVRDWFWGNIVSADTRPERNNVPVRDYGAQRFPDYRCAVWQGFRDAGIAYREQVGGPPPQGTTIVRTGALTAGVPFTPYDKVWWPSGYGARAARHEFAHVFRHLFDGSEAHFIVDAGRYGYARHHSATSCAPTNDGFAFNEGWAEYWAGEVSAPCPDKNDGRIERNVAAGLKQLETDCGLSRAQMVQTLAAHRSAIHSFNDFRSRVSCPVPPPMLIEDKPEVIDDPNSELRGLLKVGRTFVLHSREVVLKLERDVDVAVAVARRLPPCLPRCGGQMKRRLTPLLLRGQLEQARAQTRGLAFLADRAAVRRFLRRAPLERQLRRLDARRRAAVAESRRIAVQALTRTRRAARALRADRRILRTLAGARAAVARGDLDALAGLPPTPPPGTRRVGPTPPAPSSPGPQPPSSPGPQPPAPSPQADLVIDRVFLTQTTSTQSGWVWNIIVRNAGDAGAGESKTGFTESGAQEVLIATPALAAGESFTHQVDCRVQAPAEASARADATGVVAESNESDNGRTADPGGGSNGTCTPPGTGRSTAFSGQRAAPHPMLLLRSTWLTGAALPGTS